MYYTHIISDRLYSPSMWILCTLCCNVSVFVRYVSVFHGATEEGSSGGTSDVCRAARFVRKSRRTLLCMLFNVYMLSEIKFIGLS